MFSSQLSTKAGELHPCLCEFCEGPHPDGLIVVIRTTELPGSQDHEFVDIGLGQNGKPFRLGFG